MTQESSVTTVSLDEAIRMNFLNLAYLCLSHRCVCNTRFNLFIQYCFSKQLQNQRDTRHAEGANCRGVLLNTLQKKTIDKTSNVAQKAAQEAKAASEAQNIAGQQAARQVFNYYLLDLLITTYIGTLFKRCFTRILKNRDVRLKIFFIYNTFCPVLMFPR